MIVIDEVQKSVPKDVMDTMDRFYNGRPKVLDVACGGRMFYFDKDDPRVFFIDNRRIKTTLCDGRDFEVNPDVIADFTDIPFPDEHFNMVVFDPPHLLKNKEGTPTGYQQIKYGYLLKENWKEVISKGFAECFRVLKKNGVLIFKWNETDIKVNEILALTKEKPIFGHKSGKQSKTHWICFMK